MKTPIQIIEENIEVYSKLYDDALKGKRTINPGITYLTAVSTLETLKYEVSALPSLESKIDTLQRYDLTLVTQLPKMNKSIVGDYVKYSDLVDLFEKKI